MSLQRRIWAMGVGAFVVMTTILIATPITISYPPTPGQIAWVITGVIVLSLISWRIIKHGLSPLIRVAQDVEATTNLDAARRIETAPGLPELDGIVLAHNALVERLRAQRRATVSALIEGQELERARLSRELHDDVGQTLTYALLLLQSAQDDPHSQQKIAMAQDAVRTSLQTVRQLAADLRPSVLADIGLVSALTSLATAHAEATGMAVRREINPVPVLGWAAQLVVYRVAQEALTNCAKHSAASVVTLSLTHRENLVQLVVTDNGKGLGEAIPGTGIAGMRDRALSINASLNVADNPDGGTRIELCINLDTLPKE